MSIVIPFKGKAERTAEQNLSDFIKFAKKNCPFKEVVWDENIWPVADIVEKKMQTKGGEKAYFRDYRERGKKVKSPLSEPYNDFAKAAFSEHMRKRRLTEFGKLSWVLRALESVLLQNGKKPCVTQITVDILEATSSLIRKTFSHPSSYGRTLEAIVNDIINPARITPIPLLWKNNIPDDKPVRNDAVNENRRTEKLPDVAAIIALGKIFHESEDPRDIVVTSFTALAMFAPSRAMEILSLPVDCITHATTKFGEQMGLRWLPVKSGQPLTKFTTTKSLEEVATLAVKRLLKLGQKARTAAAWYEENPDKLFLPEGWEHMRRKNLTIWEMSQIFGKESFSQKHLDSKNIYHTGEYITDPSRLPPGFEPFVRKKSVCLLPLIPSKTGC